VAGREHGLAKLAMLVAAKEPWWQQLAEKVKAQTDGANSRKSPPPVRGHFCAAKCPCICVLVSRILPFLFRLSQSLLGSLTSHPRGKFLSYLQIEIVLQRYFFYGC